MTIQTSRLSLEALGEADSPWILTLLNDPDWLRFIGDKHVHSEDDARRYLRDGPMAMLARQGHALCRVVRRADGMPLGMCGLLRRHELDAPDLGFAFLPVGRGQGYAREAAAATLRHGFEVLRLPRIVAITDDDNVASAGVLEAIGMRFERHMRLPNEATRLRLYALDEIQFTALAARPQV